MQRGDGILIYIEHSHNLKNPARGDLNLYLSRSMPVLQGMDVNFYGC